MIRTLKMFAVGAVLVAAGCSGSGSGSDTPTTPTPSGSLQGGYFASCIYDSGLGNDIREALIFSGSNVEFRAWDYPSVNGSCTGLPTLADMDSGTFTLGAAVTVPNPSGSGEVAANRLDVAMTLGSFYTLGWVSPSDALYVGDDSGLNDASTPALRPTALQTKARWRTPAPASFAALLPGTFATCTDDPVGNDIREVFSIDGSAMEVREYDHLTTNGTCGGDGWLNLSGVGGQGTISLGAALDAAFWAFTVSATPVDFVPSGVGSTTYQLLWMDTYATTPTLYAGDDSDPLHDGSTVGKRPIALQDLKPRYKQAAPPAFPAVVDGTWDSCVMEPGAPNVDRWERFVISGTSVTFTETVYASGDGTCTGAVNSSTGGTGTFVFGATTAATLGGFDVTAHKVDVVGMYTIIHVDTMASPHTLYLGDEGATAGLDATSDAKRPTVLQGWKPRFKQ